MDAIPCIDCATPPRRPCAECHEVVAGCARHGTWVPLDDAASGRVMCDACVAGQMIMAELAATRLTPRADPERWAYLREHSAHYRAVLWRRERMIV